MIPGGLFITGTDTGVGKTLVACSILERLGASGLSTAAFKPVAAGARQTAAGWRNEDAEFLMTHGSVPLDYAQVNPVTLPEAIAPHIAGESQVYIETQLKAFRSGKREHEIMSVVAQGLSDDDIADLAAWYSSIQFTVTMPE